MKLSCSFPVQVKIWFQNRRSKFKKIYKSGDIPLDHSPDASDSMACNSPPSPSTAAVWDNNNNALPDPAARGQAAQPSMNSSPSYVEDYSHHQWYQPQQSSHLPHSGTVHHTPPAQNTGTVY